MSEEVRVLLYHRTEDADGVLAAYHATSSRLAGVDGLYANEFLHSVHDPAGFVVVSSWRSLDAFVEWEQGASHRSSTAPLRPYRDAGMSRPFGVYRVLAAH
ncbi:antibiotic biosynthesis monooxygenase family protein [Amycolatopsis sp. NPDC059021]|uniref:antibiotic biosynthesis monooxygenase family protein n=1 Tax=Amycolatopsis sp. NPDC059021 TaxID=3346704 RepID=UPI0036735BD6